MLQMPGVVNSSQPLTEDTVQMAKADNNFQREFLSPASLYAVAFFAIEQEGHSL
jgi:hypothetical protein